MGLVLLIMTVAAGLVAAEIAALAVYRDFRVIFLVTTPVAITVVLVFGGIYLWDQNVQRLDLASDATLIQSVAAASGVVLMTALSRLLVKPRGRSATLTGSVTIALASVAAMLGAIRLWHLMMG